MVAIAIGGNYQWAQSECADGVLAALPVPLERIP